MSFHFGLYFGSTNLCLAVHRDGETNVLANAAGDRVTPAVVAFLNGEPTIGLGAKQGMVRNATNTITRVKSVVGGNETTIEEEIKRSKCKLIVEGGLKYEIAHYDKFVTYSPHQILVLLFRNMIDIAKSHSHDADAPTVVTVPLHFSHEQRAIINQAATEAGFRLLRMIIEPAAAALAYDIGQDLSESPCHFLVYRMGGTSLDVTVIRAIDGLYSVLSTVRRSNFGGNVFTEQLMDFCSKEFQRQYKLDIYENRRSVIKLQSACEASKHVLSMQGSTRCCADSIYDGVDLSIVVSRARFESLIKPALQQCAEPIQEALEKASLSVGDIKKVILAGGSCKVPKLQQLLSDMFPLADVLSSLSPDEVIAMGAAKEAVLVPEGEGKEINEKDCFVDTLSEGLYVKIPGVNVPEFTPLLHKGSPIPAFGQKVFTFADEPDTLILEIYQQKETSKVGDQSGMVLLTKVTVPDLLTSEITVGINISRDRTIHVTCTDNISKMKSTVVVRPQINTT